MCSVTDILEYAREQGMMFEASIASAKPSWAQQEYSGMVDQLLYSLAGCGAAGYQQLTSATPEFQVRDSTGPTCHVPCSDLEHVHGGSCFVKHASLPAVVDHGFPNFLGMRRVFARHLYLAHNTERSLNGGSFGVIAELDVLYCLSVKVLAAGLPAHSLGHEDAITEHVKQRQYLVQLQAAQT